MKLHACIFIAILAMTAPTQALLGAKLALFGILRNSLGGGGSIGGYGNGGGYGGGYGNGYGGAYNGGYGNGGYKSLLNYNRPVYTGQSSNYGWGQQSYGGGYSSGFDSGYNSGYDGGNVKVIKVIVNHEQPQAYYDNYARSLAASNSAVSTSSGASWTSIPSPDTVPAAAPVQVIQPPPRPVYFQAQPQFQYTQRLQPIYQQVAVQRPIQYLVQKPVYQQPQAQQTIRLIVDGESQHAPAQTYGPPSLATTYVAPSADNAGAYNSNSWTSSNSGSGSGNIGGGPWKSGSIYEKVGC